MALKAIRLESGDGLSATFVPQAGMIAVSLRCEGDEMLGQRHGIESYVESGKTMGIPLLYPWANRLARDTWSFAGQTVVFDSSTEGIRRDENGLAIHGTLAASPLWQVETSTGDELESATLKASLDFGEHPELLESFPFPHRLELEATLSGNSLSMTTTVTPTSDVAVPLAFGFHPYIALSGTDRRDWMIDLPAMTALEADDRGIPTGVRSDFGAITETLGNEHWDRGFVDVGQGAAFTVSDQNRKVTVGFETGYPAAQVFAPAAENVVCFEPMKAPTNALVTGDGLTSVAPGGQDVSRFTITVARVETGDRNRFRIDREAPADEVKRVAGERVRSALRSLRETGPEERTEAIHDARKDLKKMRSVLRLVRKDLGKQEFRTENHRYRDAARLLSQHRDQDVLLQTVESLRDGYPQDAASLDALILELKSREPEAGSDGPDRIQGHMLEAAAAIERGGGLIASWKLEEADWSLFESGLRRTYRDGRRALAEAETGTSPGTLHEWRKRVKDLWYQLRLLRNAWPPVLKSQAKEAGHLADLLGRHNDLSLLIMELDSRPDPAGFSELKALATGRQREILDEAFPLGYRLYAEEPADFTSRIGSYWRS